MEQNLERWLFVCSGNICRSPFAEAAARSLSRLPGVEFASAGTIALPGNPATPSGVEAAAGLGVDLTGHRATHLTPEVVAGADRIFGMEDEHVAAVLGIDAGARVDLLSPHGHPIPDPYGGDRQEYAASYALVLEAVRMRLDEEDGRPGHGVANSLC